MNGTKTKEERIFSKPSLRDGESNLPNAPTRQTVLSVRMRPGGARLSGFRTARIRVIHARLSHATLTAAAAAIDLARDHQSARTAENDRPSRQDGTCQTTPDAGNHNLRQSVLGVKPGEKVGKVSLVLPESQIWLPPLHPNAGQGLTVRTSLRSRHHAL